MPITTVTIRASHYAQLLSKESLLNLLMDNGVGEWDGYQESLEEYEETTIEGAIEQCHALSRE
jgi:hypothetical protein